MADVFTSAGEGFVVDQMDAFGTFYHHWGTGTNTAAKGDTVLQTPGSEARVATTDSQPTADTFRTVATLTADGAKTITEFGLFSLITGGVLIVRADFTGIVLALNDKIEFTCDLVFS